MSEAGAAAGLVIRIHAGMTADSSTHRRSSTPFIPPGIGKLICVSAAVENLEILIRNLSVNKPSVVNFTVDRAHAQ